MIAARLARSVLSAGMSGFGARGVTTGAGIFFKRIPSAFYPIDVYLVDITFWCFISHDTFDR